MNIDKLIRSRHSVRAFTPQPVEKELITDILETASYAPSGSNSQPWQIYVVAGQKRAQLISQVCELYEQINTNPTLGTEYQEVFSYYPQKWISPYLERRRENGWGLYGLLGIRKGEKQKMHQQQKRNFQLFDAPVVLFITTNKAMGEGAKLDIGMFMQNVMLAAKDKGLDTCPQTAWNTFHKIILPLVGAKEDEFLLSAIALGYSDTENVVNTFITPREKVNNFTKWLMD